MRRALALITLVVSVTAVAARPAQEPPAAPRVVEIQAKKFQFTPDAVSLKKGEPVTIRLVSTDRAHGLFVKPLGIDLDTDAGPHEVTITPQETGRFPAICDHYCGSGHGGMKMTFVVE